MFLTSDFYPFERAGGNKNANKSSNRSVFKILSRRVILFKPPHEKGQITNSSPKPTAKTQRFITNVPVISIY